MNLDEAISEVVERHGSRLIFTDAEPPGGRGSRSRLATIRELRDFALAYDVTQGLYWPAAILREGDFTGRIPKTQRNLLTGSGLQRDERRYSSATTSE